MLRYLLVHEYRRLILWLPVCFGAGALLYLSLRFEPSPSMLLPIAPALWVSVRLWRRGYRVWLLFAALTLFLLGFVWAQGYTRWYSVTMLDNELRFTEATGRIIEISDVPKGYRITLDEVRIDELPANKTPQRVRVKLRGDGEALMTGQRVSLRAGLLPPTGPVMPGAFDFARYFYFRGIGAVGYAVPPVAILEPKKESSFWLELTELRKALSDRIRSQMSEREGAVAAALMMGDRAAIPEDVNQIMRDTNLSHILAISGMHMALVTGLLFFALRWLIATIPATRYLRHPKKMAAVLSLMAGLVYLLLAGFPISASRAFIMVALIFGAILIDRQVMPMRSLAVAALLLLLVNPSYVIEPGFQLSFIATAALIAWYERVRDTADKWFEPEQRAKRVAVYITGVLTTSFVAEAATAPLVLYHFNSLSIYGLLANLLVMPIVSFWIMPFIVLSFLLLPFGLEFITLDPVEWGISAMLAVAEWVANIPGAQFFEVAPPGCGMAIAAFGMVWLILWRSRLRLIGLLPIALGMLTLITVSPPDLLVTKDLKQIAGRVDGQLMMLRGRGNSFTPQQWAHGTGQALLKSLPKGHDAWQCDSLGCLYRTENQMIAFPSSFEAQAQDCMRADYVITPFYLYDSACKASVIDKRNFADNGSYWLWLGDKMERQSTRDIHGERPWSK